MKEEKDMIHTFNDGNGGIFSGTPREIVIQMKHIEWGNTPPAQEWKERVRMRAIVFGIEMQFHDAYSFLLEMERHGLGRFIPDVIGETGNDLTKTDDSGTFLEI